ncbi:MAG: D-alanine--D-alanine ligase [Oxalobacter sp.]|nr:D-alanine--D-alanine ligase [Oxalobacter sp.]
MEKKDFGKVGVLYGGKAAERKVSLVSGAAVCEALKSKGVDAHLFDTGTQDVTSLQQAGFDRVFIALHGRYGEDGCVQGLLEQMQVPYTGSGVMASAIAMDKIMTKRVWIAEGLPTPRYMELKADSDPIDVVEYLGLPLIVKPAHEGSTIGLTKVTSPDQLAAAYQKAAEMDSAVLAEEFIAGKELTCAVIDRNGEPEALPLIRIIAPDANYDYHNKYFSTETQYLCPCGLDIGIEEAIQEYVLRAYKALGCRGWGRVDVMLRESDSKPFLLELNASPGMTGHSLVPIAARQVGLGYEDLCVTLLEGATLDYVHHKKD